MVLFPYLTTIDPLLDAVKDMPEIGVREDHENGYGYIMYQVAFEETFADPEKADTQYEKMRRLLLREARGIKYDLETRQIISRPYHKFFNIGEKPESLPNLIDFTRSHVILEKLDGSMLTPLLKKRTNEILWMTKRGVTSVADTALQFLVDNPRYDSFCRSMISLGQTPIFEWCTRKQRIILDYGPEDRMVLTGIRVNDSGEYMRYNDMVSLADTWNITVVKALPFSVTDVDEFIKLTRALEGEEGYIVRFDNGEMYKIKGDWYCLIHKTFDNLRFEKDVIRLILSGDLDDAKPLMIPTLLGAVNTFESAMRDALNMKASWIYWETVTAKDSLNHSKKKFAELVMGNTNFSKFKGFFFRAWDNDSSESEIYEHLLGEMISATGSAGNVERARHIINGLNWHDYLNSSDNE
jgi:RNA ligase